MEVAVPAQRILRWTAGREVRSVLTAATALFVVHQSIAMVSFVIMLSRFDAGGAPEPLAVLLLARVIWFVLCYHAVRDLWNRESKARPLARLMLRLPDVVCLLALTLLVLASVGVLSTPKVG